MTYSVQQIFDKAIDIFRKDPTGEGSGKYDCCLIGQLDNEGYIQKYEYVWNEMKEGIIKTILVHMEAIYEGWSSSSPYATSFLSSGKRCANWEQGMIQLGLDIGLDVSKLTKKKEISRQDAVKFLETVEC